MIVVENLYKSFDDNLVLDNVSATFDKGITNLVIGQSGMGKTVLLKCIVGLLEPDSGNILFNGEKINNIDEVELNKFRKDIGMLFQGGALFDSLTAEENVMFPLNMFTNFSYKEKLERVNFCLNRVNLHNVNKKYPSELSGGMKKRVGIARAIALKPKYLFCDEPNSGLDPITAKLIDELIKELTDELKITTVVVTHDMKSVMRIGEKVFFMYNGKIWWQGDNKSILTSDNAELKEFVTA
ncbi:MAG: ATP-binding cassette domain-containing protein [Lentimicrobiaceae bacterium]|nr:ATP-binding cassette domain-containing protein [Lentimicrobiaceae bacterium]